MITILSDTDIADRHRFYEVKFASKSKNRRIEFKKRNITELIKTLGYYRYRAPEGGIQFIRILDKKISVVEDEDIMFAVKQYIKDLPPLHARYTNDTDGTTIDYTITADALLDDFYEQQNALFAGHFLTNITPDDDIIIQRDEPHRTYFYFEDTVVVATPDGIQRIPYSDLRGYVWQSAILPIRYIDIRDRTSDFEQFCLNICGRNPDRLRSLQSLLGYLTHDFYETDLKAVIFTDVNEDGDGNNLNAGGTGKGIIGKALSHMLNRNASDARYVAIGGKDLDMEKDTRYALADISTQLLHLEDVKKNFNLEALYNDITDGAKFRRPYQIKPIIKKVKFMLSTNRTLNISDTSTRRRVIIFELYNYYNDIHTPEDDFHRRFFESQWDTVDWLLFYQFMIRSAVIYHQEGVIKPDEIYYSARRLRESTNADFLYWFAGIISKNETAERRLIKRAYFDAFKEKYPEYGTGKNAITQNAFTAWCKRYLDAYKIPYIDARSTDDLLIVNPTETTRSQYQ